MRQRCLILWLVVWCWVAPSQGAGPVDAATIALHDVKTLPLAARPFVRYLWFVPFTGPEQRAQEVTDFHKVLLFHVNSLSREAEIASLVLVAPDLWRLDIRDYGWQRETYEKLADLDPYFHTKLQLVVAPAVITPVTPLGIVAGCRVEAIHNCQAFWKNQPEAVRGTIDGGDTFTVKRVSEDRLLLGIANNDAVWVRAEDFKLVAGEVNKGSNKTVTSEAPWLPVQVMSELILYTQSQAPILRADWFFLQTSRQIDRNNKQVVGYYDFLGVKKEQDLEELAGVDRKVADRLRREMRAIIAESAVALHNRQIAAIQEGYWESLDVDSNQDDRNALRQLDNDYKPVAKEVYFRLPNGLWGQAAVTVANGVLAASVPDSVASDHKSTSSDHRIHPGLSCIRCHVEGLRPLDDWARQFYANPPGDAKLASPDYSKFKRLQRLYLGPLQDRYEDDQRYYARVLLRLTGWKPEQLAKAYSKYWQVYGEQVVTGEQFARELGVEYQNMVAAYKRYAASQGGNLDPILLGYLKKPEFTARREHVEEAYVLGQLAVIAGKKEK